MTPIFDRLWHIHLSILRQYSNDTAALAKVADVITGGAAPEGDDDMPDFMASTCTKDQTFGTDYKWVYINDTGGLSLIKGPARFTAQVFASAENLPVDHIAVMRFYTVDYDADGDVTRANTFDVHEIHGTTGGTMLSHVMVGETGKPASGKTRYLRCELAINSGADLKVNLVHARAVYWPTG